MGLPQGHAMLAPAGQRADVPRRRASGGDPGPGDRIVMKPITIGTDLGNQVIVASGLGADDRVVNNPPDSLANGDQVRVAQCGINI